VILLIIISRHHLRIVQIYVKNCNHVLKSLNDSKHHR